MMNDVMTRIAEIGIVPVIRIDDVAKAPQLAQALCSGGVPVAEITFRAAGADRAIRACESRSPTCWSAPVQCLHAHKLMPPATQARSLS